MLRRRFKGDETPAGKDWIVRFIDEITSIEQRGEEIGRMLRRSLIGRLKEEPVERSAGFFFCL